MLLGVVALVTFIILFVLVTSSMEWSYIVGVAELVARGSPFYLGALVFWLILPGLMSNSEKAWLTNFVALGKGTPALRNSLTRCFRWYLFLS